ncbi:Hypothetical predicted protein [Mytilus galloprovincialis]|uniref:Uncharacterized protein n=1 Tax=Mytilus galloprovincialis TaxID=29158 RepID=A0A8B6DRL1_MYTGA|nr:Hypothetical predicted protein [Mytilus galloprovincialis]
MQLAIEREHIFRRHVEVWGDIFPNKSTFWSEKDMDTCLELITDQVKLLESGQGMDIVWVLHHACSESVGVTLKKGSWVSTNDVTSVVEVEEKKRTEKKDRDMEDENKEIEDKKLEEKQTLSVYILSEIDWQRLQIGQFLRPKTELMEGIRRSANYSTKSSRDGSRVGAQGRKVNPNEKGDQPSTAQMEATGGQFRVFGPGPNGEEGVPISSWGKCLRIRADQKRLLGPSSTLATPQQHGNRPHQEGDLSTARRIRKAKRRGERDW